MRNVALDLLFFHPGLNCLVAIELKEGRFKPEYLGKLGVYLEALDWDVRKSHEYPAEHSDFYDLLILGTIPYVKTVAVTAYPFYIVRLQFKQHPSNRCQSTRHTGVFNR
jgi:hypothetical protein